MAHKTITISGEVIEPGKSYELNFDVAKLHTASSIDVPILVERSRKPGPTVLITAGIHGDELNGIEIVRQIIAKGINKPKCGTIICIPIINIFGFINLSREFPDGRDLNRVFPGIENGSLASRVAYKLVHEIVNQVDYILDFHTGGADRFNAPQIRIAKDNPELKTLAKTFGAPFVLYSKTLKKSFRETATKSGISMLLFEGGKSHHIDNNVTLIGVTGTKRILSSLNMLHSKFKINNPKQDSVFITTSKWQRANFSGMFKASVVIGSKINKNDVLGNITDPYGKFNHAVRASQSGYVINVNQSPLVHQGDALFHITSKLTE
ncbi:succinylglutamate desuccinylase/aspartoacylase family protein [Bizionia sp. KMM 8389]